MTLCVSDGNILVNPREARRTPERLRGRKRKEKATMKYVCKVCGYVYDPAENNGVPFEELPEDWTCPVCGVGKSEFEPA